MPRWPSPTARRCRRNGRCRNSGFPLTRSGRWRQANGLGTGKAVALAPGSVGASKRWTYYGEAARLLAEQGLDVWVVGGPGEKAMAQEIVAAGGPEVRDLTGTDLRNGILAMAAASVAISNDSGLMHIAAATGHADHGHFRSHQPLSLGAAERPCRHRADHDAARLPALPAHDLHHERPSLHARHFRHRGGRHRAARADAKPRKRRINDLRCLRARNAIATKADDRNGLGAA